MPPALRLAHNNVTPYGKLKAEVENRRTHRLSLAEAAIEDLINAARAARQAMRDGRAVAWHALTEKAIDAAVKGQIAQELVEVLAADARGDAGQ